MSIYTANARDVGALKNSGMRQTYDQLISHSGHVTTKNSNCKLKAIIKIH